jgi:putative ABC transport system permease protein
MAAARQRAERAMKNSGILRIGFKLLVNDKGKFTALLIGITFAVFLMMQMTAMFAGILNRAYSTVTNIGAEHVGDGSRGQHRHQRDTDAQLPARRGAEHGRRQLRGAALHGRRAGQAPDGTYQAVSVVGLDDDSLFGRPELEQGNIQDIYADKPSSSSTTRSFPKLENPKIGSTFELNNHRGTIVGIAKVASNGLNGVPTLYTTYNRAIQYIPADALHDLLHSGPAKSDAAVAGIKRQVAKLGYVAFTKDEFNKRIADFYTYQTGIGTNILLMTVISLHRRPLDLGSDLSTPSSSKISKNSAR